MRFNTASSASTRPKLIQRGRGCWEEEFATPGCRVFRIVDPDFETVVQIIRRNEQIDQARRKHNPNES